VSIVLCNKYTGFEYGLSDVSTKVHYMSTGFYNEYIYLVHVLSNVSTIHNSAKTVLYIECTEKLYAEQWYYVLVVIKLEKILVNSFGYLYNDNVRLKNFFWRVTEQ
jgi:ubiquinone biosynthesis protein Coq4